MSGCTQCGTTAGQLERRNREAAKQWEDNPTDLCPPCIDRWNKPTGSHSTTPRCGGCGRRNTALTGGVCGKCTANGVTAPTLFEEA